MKAAEKKEFIARTNSRFPRSAALRLSPVEHATGFYDGYDLEDVAGLLGPTRYAAFLATLKEDFVCAHRTYSATHPDPKLRWTEVHCCWAKDLEAFLSGGN